MATNKKKPGSSGKSNPPKHRNCGSMRNHERLMREVPGYIEARNKCEEHAWRAAQSKMIGRSGCTKIPVVVHVVHRTANEDISDAQIQSQIDVLNRDYRKANADVANVPAPFTPLAADARITFELATTDPDGSQTTGITRTSTEVDGFTYDDAVKSVSSGGADAWPAADYLNIWVCKLSGGLLGYAQFPGGPTATDGVVVTHTGFGTTGTAQAPFDLGRTATHEIGHWLNLLHIWGDDGSGCYGSDNVPDTPNQGGYNVGTPSFPKLSCSNGPNGDMFMNYMDYVDDQAMFMFTEGQVERMQATLDGPRSSIGTAVPCVTLTPKTFPKDLIKDSPKDLIKDSPKDLIKDSPKDLIKDNPKDMIKDGIKDLIKDSPKDSIKDGIKDLIKDGPKDNPKDLIKDSPKELAKELPKDNPFDVQKGLHGDLGPKGLDPGPYVHGGGLLPHVQPYGAPVGVPQSPTPLNPTPGGMPFVLGTGHEAAPQSPGSPLANSTNPEIAALQAGLQQLGAQLQQLIAKLQ